MDQRYPTRDFLEGLHFTFPSDSAPVVDEPAPAATAAVRAASEPEPDGDDEDGARWNPHFGETPLTDPRSLGSSALVHAVLLVVVSLTALNAALPRAAEGSSALRGELEPVDNRAGAGKVGGSGGGSPGEIGGLGGWRSWRRRPAPTRAGRAWTPRPTPCFMRFCPARSCPRRRS